MVRRSGLIASGAEPRVPPTYDGATLLRVLEPSSHLVRRRAARRAQVRRRRLAVLGVGVAVVAAAAVVLIGGGGGNGAASGGSSGAAHGSGSPGGSAILGARSRSRGGRSGTRGGSVARAVAAGNATIRRLARLGLPIYCAGPRGNAVAFTFDDGPGPYTHYALTKLTQAGERATFFAVGRSIDRFPGWLVRELKVAAIGDHTYTHPVLPALSPSGITSELERTKQRIEAESGQPVDLFRPPYGSRDATVDRIAEQLGLLEIVWNVDSADSLGANYAQIIHNVEAGLHPGAIILMHENRGQTIRALTTILPELHRRHMRSVSLPELFASDPPSVAQVRKGSAGCSLAGGATRGNGG